MLRCDFGTEACWCHRMIEKGTGQCVTNVLQNASLPLPPGATTPKPVITTRTIVVCSSLVFHLASTVARALAAYLHKQKKRCNCSGLLSATEKWQRRLPLSSTRGASK